VSDPFRSCAVIGVGLIGGSLGQALRRSGRTVLGLDSDAAALEEALAKGVIDRIGSVEGEADSLAGVELVLVAVPPASVVSVVKDLAKRLNPQTVVVDVASVKGPLVRECEAALQGRARYIGSHPMFGTEGRGVGAADADLLQGAPWIFTPTALSDPLALAAIERLAGELKMRPLRLRVEEHDGLMAAVSHVPYLLSIALTRLNGGTQVAGPNFRGMTRVSASPTALWNEILGLNGRAVRAEVDRFCRELTRLASLEGEPLLAALEEARALATGR
jgi:prephenate dehydrogenase